MALRLAPVFLSALLLAAHFLRNGAIGLVVLTLFIPFLLLLARPWAVRLVQVGLILGAIEWLRTLVQLWRVRLALGEPWLRMVVILGTVSLLTACSALVFRNRKIREKFHLA